MPRYFLQLRHGENETLDPEGTEYSDTCALERAMFAGARDLIAGDVKNGLIDLRFRIDAEDEDGALVRSLRFVEAVDLIRAA